MSKCRSYSLQTQPLSVRERVWAGKPSAPVAVSWSHFLSSCTLLIMELDFGFLAREAVAFRIRSYSSVRIRKAISACYTVSRARKPYLPAILFLVRESQILLIASPHSRLPHIVISTAGLPMFPFCRSMAKNISISRFGYWMRARYGWESWVSSLFRVSTVRGSVSWICLCLSCFSFLDLWYTDC